MIYLDHLTATPCLPEAAAAVARTLEEFPGDLRAAGLCGREAASHLNGMIDELRTMSGAAGVHFTSGGSDANLHAVIGTGRAMLDRGRCHIITTGLEHYSMMTAIRRLESEGCSVDWLPTGPDGRVDPSRLRDLMRPETGLVAVRHANPVSGILQPVEEIAEIAGDPEVHLHVDCCVSMGRMPLNLEDRGFDSASVSGRAAGGGPGAGALLTRTAAYDDIDLYPGNACPPSLPAVAGMMTALRKTGLGIDARARMADDLRTEALKGLRDRGVSFEVTGGEVPRLPGACLIRLTGPVPAVFHAAVERAGVILPCPLSSERLACLREMGQDTSEPGTFVGFCFSPENTILDVEHFLRAVTESMK